MANHNLHTFLQNNSAAVAINPQSANAQIVDRQTALDYISSPEARMAPNGAIVVNPHHSDSNVIVIVFVDEIEKTVEIAKLANAALYEIREDARLKEIAELEERLAYLRAKG